MNYFKVIFTFFKKTPKTYINLKKQIIIYYIFTLGVLMNVIEKLNSIQNKEMTAKENVENFIKVIDEKNEELNIFLEVNKESALKQAEAIDEKIANGEEVGFLSGLVFGIKANINVED